MTSSPRALNKALRRFADQSSAELAAIPAARVLKATVATVVIGGASDGTALVYVTWRGATLPVNDYPDSYTPVVGHRVRCVLDADNELAILHHCIGTP